MVSDRILLAVQKEKSSKTYAMKYYEEESDMAALFSLDTVAMDTVIKVPGKLFDAMMGRGRHVMHFAKRGFEVEGNDYNPFMVQLTRKACRDLGLNVVFHNKDVTNLVGIPSKKFDVVICVANSLGCVPGSQNRQKAMNEFARIVKPGGKVIFHVFNRLACVLVPGERAWFFSTYLFRKKGLEVGDWLFYHGKELGETYNHIFSLEEAKKLMQNAGFALEEVRFIDQENKGYVRGPLKSWRAGSFLIVGKKPDRENGAGMKSV